jgi:hypothetical protein
LCFKRTSKDAPLRHSSSYTIASRDRTAKGKLDSKNGCSVEE